MQVSWSLDTREFDKKLDRLRRSGMGAGSRMPAMMRALGLAALSDIERDFVTLSRGGSVGGRRWQRLSPVTAMFRRRGSATKITDMADARRRAARMPILRDTGSLLMSFSPGRSRNLLKVEPLRVIFGTKDSRAALLHRGGRTTFDWDADKEKRFDRNVRKTLPGPKPEFTPTGRRSRAKKNWNAFFFQMRNFYRGKGDGKSYRVPARKLIGERPTQVQANRYVRIIAHWLSKILRGA